MKTVEVFLKELPDEVLYVAWLYDLSGIHGEKGIEKPEYRVRGLVKMDAHPKDGGHFVFGKDGLPLIAILDGGKKCYLLDAPSRANQDASDLPLYEEVYAQATNHLEKDEETCTVIRGLDFLLIEPLLENIVMNQENETLVRELRGRILRAKFNAVTIWREGKLRKEKENA